MGLLLIFNNLFESSIDLRSYFLKRGLTDFILFNTGPTCDRSLKILDANVPVEKIDPIETILCIAKKPVHPCVPS